MAAVEDGRRTGRRAALLEATLRVVARDGPAGASHRAVATEAGVPLGSTTYYFASRDEMLAEALRHAADQEVARTRATVQRLRGRRFTAARAQREAAAWALEGLEPERVHLLIARHHLRLEALRSAELRAAYGAWTAAVLELAEAVLAAAGSGDPPTDAAILVAAIDGLQLNAVVLLDEPRRRRLVRRAVARALERLGAG
jgi:DNA-binding transcriptional regulator YbjK